MKSLKSSNRSILMIEPYYGGSHKSFADGLITHSRHSFELFQLPARKWKWRMRASAINAARWIESADSHFDLIFASDFLSMADLAGLSPTAASIPKIAYFHENQFTYPEQGDDNRDYQFLFTNITTALASDLVLFNSQYHRQTFIRETGLFLKRMPDFVPEGVPEDIEAKSGVLHVGCSLHDCTPGQTSSGPLVILWNHRWEHDKDPETFFKVLLELRREGCDFRLIVLGESFREYPAIFDVAREKLAAETIHFGYAPERADYLKWLQLADVIVSTAWQEFFGIAVVEAIACGCYPLLPERLSYPELLPRHCHGKHLYENKRALKNMLKQLALNPEIARRENLSQHVEHFSWQQMAPQYDAFFEKAASK